VYRCVADGGLKESQLYYTTPQAKKQAGNAGNAREKPGNRLLYQPLSGKPLEGKSVSMLLQLDFSVFSCYCM